MIEKPTFVTKMKKRRIYKKVVKMLVDRSEGSDGRRHDDDDDGDAIDIRQ